MTTSALAYTTLYGQEFELRHGTSPGSFDIWRDGKLLLSAATSRDAQLKGFTDDQIKRTWDTVCPPPVGLTTSQLITQLLDHLLTYGDTPVMQYGDDGLTAPVRYTEAQLTSEDKHFVLLY